MATNYTQDKKKTRQGAGAYTKKTAPGGETFHNNHRSGTPPSKSHRRKKPYRGQGK
tara:strand:+ start:52 stop:219 length:168 start_codon:yes stop_codon:yes gene_type:complete